MKIELTVIYRQIGSNVGVVLFRSRATTVVGEFERLLDPAKQVVWFSNRKCCDIGLRKWNVIAIEDEGRSSIFRNLGIPTDAQKMHNILKEFFASLTTEEQKS